MRQPWPARPRPEPEDDRGDRGRTAARSKAKAGRCQGDDRDSQGGAAALPQPSSARGKKRARSTGAECLLCGARPDRYCGAPVVYPCHIVGQRRPSPPE